jgi:hypothetical protein
MSRTKKDLQSHKTGFGEFQKPQRRLTPFIHNANKIAGKNEVLVHQPDNDLSEDGFNTGEHWHNAKAVRSKRKQVRADDIIWYVNGNYACSPESMRIDQEMRKLLGNSLVLQYASWVISQKTWNKLKLQLSVLAE